MIYQRLRELNNVDFLPHSYYHSSFDNTFSMVPHAHPYLELMYVHSGEAIIKIFQKNKNNNIQATTLTLKEKQFILIDAGTIHTILIKSQTPIDISNCEWAMIPKSTNKNASSLISLNARDFFEQLEGLKRFAYSPNGYSVALDSANLEHCLTYYIDLILKNDFSLANTLETQSRFIRVLVELDKCLTPSNLGTGILYIKRAQDFMKNNFNRPITLDEIADCAGVSKTHLQRLFKTHVGMSVLQSLNCLRISKCKQILTETNLTIDEICNHVGFNNRQQLIYEFKIQTGTTPINYRTDFLNKNFRYSPQLDEYTSSDINGNPIGVKK